MTSPSAEATGPPYPYEKQESLAFTAWVERRAVELCIDAGPEHTDIRPCSLHVQDARWEGFGAWGLGP